MVDQDHEKSKTRTDPIKAGSRHVVPWLWNSTFEREGKLRGNGPRDDDCAEYKDRSPVQLHWRYGEETDWDRELGKAKAQDEYKLAGILRLIVAFQSSRSKRRGARNPYLKPLIQRTWRKLLQ